MGRSENAVVADRSDFKGEAGDDLDEKGFGQQRAVSVGATESSFLYQYLTQCEGPLWRGIRGEGLAYGANIYVQPDKKLLTLSLYRGAQINHAYEETKKIVKVQMVAAENEVIANFPGIFLLHFPAYFSEMTVVHMMEDRSMHLSRMLRFGADRVEYLSDGSSLYTVSISAIGIRSLKCLLYVVAYFS
uniref:Uncharacterized protein n=1 Tax=Parascaris equorum TaxID=6256 RepID=A0A914RY58_PAREQ